MQSQARVDKILIALGPYGLFQILQFGYCLLSMIPITYPVLIYVFIGHTPSFQCRNGRQSTSQYNDFFFNSTSNLVVEYGKCDVTIYNYSCNSTEAKVATLSCLDGREFDVEADNTIISEWDLVCERQGLGGLSITLFALGQMIGSLVFTSLSDLYGRLPISCITHIVFFVTSVALALVPTLELYMVIRTIVGSVQAGIGLCQFTYSIEIFPTSMRGTIMFVYAIAWSLCCSTLPLFAYILRTKSWRCLQLLAGLLSLHSIFSYWIQKESPRWLVAHGSEKQVRKWICTAAKMNKKDPDAIIKILYPDSTEAESHLLPNPPQVMTKNQNGLNLDECEPMAFGEVHDRKQKYIRKKFVLFDIFRKKLLLRNSLILWIALFVDNLTYYGLYLTSSAMPGDRFLNFFLSAIAEIPGNILFSLIVDRIGRRKSNVLLHVIAGLSLITSVTLLTFKDNPTAIKTSMVFGFLGKMGITGSYNLLYLYTPELYPTDMRNFGLGSTCVAATVAAMVAPYSSSLVDTVLWGPGVIFGIGCIVVAGLSCMLPETKGQELPQTLGDMINWTKPDEINTTGKKINRKINDIRKG